MTNVFISMANGVHFTIESLFNFHSIISNHLILFILGLQIQKTNFDFNLTPFYFCGKKKEKKAKTNEYARKA